VPNEPKNLGASVGRKLFDLARVRNEEFGLVLDRCAIPWSWSIDPA
jgi:hypothetical protein